MTKKINNDSPRDYELIYNSGKGLRKRIVYFDDVGICRFTYDVGVYCLRGQELILDNSNCVVSMKLVKR